MAAGVIQARSPSEAILDAQDIEVTLGESPILCGASISVRSGEAHVLIGPNGAGKTTLANAITGHVPITSGSLRLQGSVLRGAVSSRVHRGIGRKFQVPRVFERLSPEQNVAVAKGMRAAVDGVRAPIVAGEVLKQRSNVVASELSHGERQQLELEMVLIQRPTLVILDEPTAGMTRAERSELAAVVRRAVGEATFLIVEHDMDFVEAVADRVSFMQYGKVLLTGTFAEVAADSRVRAAYLGSGHPGRSVKGLQDRSPDLSPPTADECGGAHREAAACRPGPSARDSGSPRAASIRARRLTVFHGPLAAVRDIDLDVEAGTAVGVIGRNGAGKTTLLAGLAGQLRTNGEIELDGERIEQRPAWWRARRGVAVVPQGRGLFTGLTVLENLRLAECGPRGEGRDFDVHALFPALRALLKRRAGLLSGGEQQQVAIARALLRRPTVLLLDEPTEGLAPVIIEEIADVIQGLAAGGMTVVLAEQHRALVEWLCTHYHVLRAGETVGQGVVEPGAIERFYQAL